jgi:hypothetical protein
MTSCFKPSQLVGALSLLVVGVTDVASAETYRHRRDPETGLR